jgi:hypothetical protein
MSMLRSFRHAFRGLGLVLARERNARIHLIAAVAALAAALWLGLDRAEIAPPRLRQASSGRPDRRRHHGRQLVTKATRSGA